LIEDEDDDEDEDEAAVARPPLSGCTTTGNEAIGYQ